MSHRPASNILIKTILLGEPACGENAVFSDHAHHGKWKMDESKFFKDTFTGVSTVLEYGPEDFNKALNLWNAESVPAIKYFAGIRSVSHLMTQ